MQKPQQRKYHSSCNRSVHRETAHEKQEVKVCKRKTPHLFLMRSFLSPYGDGTYYVPQFANLGEFSPPYGDGTTYLDHQAEWRRFSLPYGDGTISLDGEKTASIVFAPLRGWYHLPASGTAERLVFAPLRDCTVPTSARARCSPSSPPYGDGTVFQNIQALSGSVFALLRGWYLTGQQIPRLFHVFAPLRGWYAYGDSALSGHGVFAPLRGWYTVTTGIFWRTLVFAPLWGWYQQQSTS